MKAQPSTKEQLIYFLYNHISLGTYDKKFINNLVTMYLTLMKPLTSNQSTLLDKITLRYERQLRKEQIDANEMVKLPWNITPIESLPSYTQAHVGIEDDYVVVRSPFKSEFIKAFKQLPTCRWERETKTWYVSANEQSLKNTISLINTHYETVNYSSEIENILNTINTYKDCLYWNPTLVKVNGLMYVAATNKSLNEAIQHIPLDGSLESIARLAYFGIKISRSVLNDIPSDVTDDEILLATESDITIEYDAISLSKMLANIKADYVLIREWNILAKELAVNLKKELESHNITTEILDRLSTPPVETAMKAKMPVLIGGYSFQNPLRHFFAKTIGLTNSKPIIIK
jgi:hypothetical protein